MRLKKLIPNVVTLANIAFGFLGIVAAAQGQFERAVLLLFCAALCDLMDGRLARMLDASSKFGMELDSLSDAISFGVAPALLVYFAALQRLGALGAAIAVAYVLCGVLRLARYNVATGELDEVTFQGVPIPIAASYLWSFVMVRDQLPLWGVAVGTATMALCMVSTLKIPKFRKGGLPGAMLWFGLACWIAFLVRPRALTWHLWNSWNVVMIVANYLMLGRQGHLRKSGGAEARSAA